MYSHHHYNYENISRDNSNGSLGRPTSMPSIYQSEKELEPSTRSSLDITSHAGSWQHHGWNHNQQDDKDTLPSIDKPTNMIPTTYSPTYFISPTSNSTTATTTTATSSPVNHGQYQRHNLVARPKLTTTLWEDEGTICYQVDANGICVARRQDNDMINGTKLLNVAGMSRGKRDGILKNEKGRVVVKVGAMHLKGVWITFARAKLLAAQYKIQDILYPLFVDDPSVFLYATALHNPMATSRLNTFNRQSNFQHATTTGWENKAIAAPNESTSYRNAGFHNASMMNSQNDDMFILSSQVDYNRTSINAYNSSNNNSHYSLYPQQQERRLYFTDELLDDNKSENNTLATDSSMYGGQKSTFSSPPSSEIGTNERRQSLVMSSKMTSPRHHPYMSPGKAYTPSIMSSLQSYRQNEDKSILNDTNRTSIDNTDRHPW